MKKKTYEELENEVAALKRSCASYKSENTKLRARCVEYLAENKKEQDKSGSVLRYNCTLEKELLLLKAVLGGKGLRTCFGLTKKNALSHR